jgi:predicted ATP-grasp superfamily ATP-dependent carboligase
MRVFVYEHFTATGFGREASSPEHGIYREGRAMRDALAADFAKLAGVKVVTFPESAGRCSPEDMILLATGCDWTIVIAPELEGILSERVEKLRESDCRVLAPSREAIALAADKLALAEHWRIHGVPTPATSEREPTACEAFPVVWKPRDGAGSTAIYRLNSALDMARSKAQREAEGHTRAMILQEFVGGTAASVAFLCGPSGNVPLVPALQRLSDDGHFHYLGGELPIAPSLAERAVNLGRCALDCVPGLLGYVGVDLVLGDTADGSRDYAIEINPRLTTSYIGLRALAEFDLAEAILAVASGGPVGPLKWKGKRVKFAAP